jgi:predicted amidophosphoribosyltransferase
MNAREKPAEDGQAAAILLMNRWLRAAVALIGTEAGCVVVTEGDTARIIARHNIPHAFLASHATVADAPYKPDERILLRDATGRTDVHAFLATIAPARIGFFFRRPLRVSAERVFSLLLFGEKPMPDLADREIHLADEIAEAIASEIDRRYPIGSSGLVAGMRMTMPELERWLDGTDLPAVLLDSKLTLLRVNARFREMLPEAGGRIEGKTLAELSLPSKGGIDLLFRHALETGISTPRMDVALEDSADGGLPRLLRVVGSPLTLSDGGDVLIATLDPSRPPEPRASITGLGRHGEDAAVEFLLETLVQRRALRGRKDISYVTLRSWRNSIRAHQIKALRAIKHNSPWSLASEIAVEMRDDIRSLFGSGGFRAVVPMPCGHSAPGRCLSEAIATALAKELGLPAVHALSLAVEAGSSHPKANAKRAPMKLLTPVEGPVLLIDDVATSGRHNEEASLLLRGGGASVLAIAWIGGDAEKDEGGN